MQLTNKTQLLIDQIDPTKQQCLDCKQYYDKSEFFKNRKFGFFCSKCPTNPLLLEPKKISKEELEKLTRQWSLIRASVGDSVRRSVLASVWDSVRDSVLDSVLDSVEDSVWSSVGSSVWGSVWDSVGNSVRSSVWSSVWAYIGGLFPEIKKWKYIENIEDPWRPLLTLWYSGYVPSFDGKIWRLHCGKDAKVVAEFNFENK